MNCRRVNSLLSAYLDAELTGSEMLEIRGHLDGCPACRAEYQTLRETKHLLAALVLQAPRAEFAAILPAEAERTSRPLGRWIPGWLWAWQGEAVSLPRPKPLVAALSVAALLLATATLEAPADRPDLSARAATPDLYPRFVKQQFVYPSSLSLADTTPLTWSAGSSPVMLTSFDRNYSHIDLYR